MSRPLRILAGTGQPGGATCLFPVINELRRRDGMEVKLLGQDAACGVFCRYRVEHCHFSSVASDTDGQSMLDLIHSYRPNLVLTGIVGPTDTGLDYRLIRAARRERLPIVSVLEAWMNYASRFADSGTGQPLAYLGDVVAVMDEGTAHEMRLEGIPDEHIRVTGHPFLSVLSNSTDNVRRREEIRTALGIGANEMFVIFFSEPLSWLASQPGYGRHPGYTEFDAFDIILQAISNYSDSTVLAVKEHPRRSSLPLREGLPKKVTLVDHLDSDPMELIAAADAVSGMSSTLLVYAFLMGKPTLVVQPNLVQSADRNVLTRRGIVRNHESVGDVAEFLRKCHRGSEPDTLQRVRQSMKWGHRTDVAVADVIAGISLRW